MKKIIVIVGIALLLAIVGFFIFNSNKDTTEKIAPVSINVPSNEEVPIKNSLVSQYTIEEVSKHNSKEDCWTIVDNKVYDISEYIALNIHGKIILSACGKDATSSFNSKHSQKSKEKLNQYYLGELK